MITHAESGVEPVLEPQKRQTLEDLLPLIYEELHRIAVSAMRSQPPGHTLQPTALIHEVYLRLMARGTPELADRTHFLSLASRMMRQILVDHARRKSANKRNVQVELQTRDAVSTPRTPDVLDLDSALTRLAEVAPRQARILEMRYFGGLELAEVAQAIGVSVPTIVRETRVAEAWLARDMSR